MGNWGFLIIKIIIKTLVNINMNSTRMRIRMKKKGLRKISKRTKGQVLQELFEKRKNLIYL